MKVCLWKDCGKQATRFGMIVKDFEITENTAGCSLGLTDWIPNTPPVQLIQRILLKAFTCERHAWQGFTKFPNLPKGFYRIMQELLIG